MERSRMACFPCFKPLSYSADSVIDKVSVHVERSEYGGLERPLLSTFAMSCDGEVCTKCRLPPQRDL